MSIRSHALRIFAVVSVICVAVTAIASQRSSQPPTVVFRGPPVPLVALTFDDGPGVTTDTILSILRHHNARATFFLVGVNARQHPEVVRRIAEEGHEIGNHTYSHPVYTAIDSPKKLSSQINRTTEVIRDICGIEPVVFRPPHGWRSPWMIRECGRKGLLLACWTIDSHDWRGQSAEGMVRAVSRKVQPGSIILFHDRLNTGKDGFRKNLVDALPRIITELSGRGYRFATVSKMHARGYPVDSQVVEEVVGASPTP